MSYGKNGKQYYIGPSAVNIDEKFIISTLMSLVAFISETTQLPDGIEAADIIEGMASAIYDNIKDEPENIGEPTPTAEE